MSKLESLFADWVQQGLITAAQRDAIAAYESAKPHRNWVVFGVSAIGIVALMTGVISIIAANWNLFSEQMQLLGYFMIQAGLGAALYWKRSAAGVTRESLLILFALFFAAGLALVGQMFHLESDGQTALQFWLALTLAVTLCAQSRLMPNLWLAGFTTAVVLWMADPPYVARIEGLEPSEVGFYYRLMTGYFIAFVCVAIGLIRQRWLNPVFRQAALHWGVAVIVIFGGSFGGIFWAFVLHKNPSLPYPILPWFGALLAILSLWFFPRPSERQGWRVAMTVLFVGCALAITLRLPVEELLSARLFALTVFLLVWGSAAAATAFSERRRLFNLCTFIIAARLVVAYFEIFGSLAATGVGLIVSGGVILGAAWGWARLKDRLLAWIGGFA